MQFPKFLFIIFYLFGVWGCACCASSHTSCSICISHISTTRVLCISICVLWRVHFHMFTLNNKWIKEADSPANWLIPDSTEISVLLRWMLALLPASCTDGDRLNSIATASSAFPSFPLPGFRAPLSQHLSCEPSQPGPLWHEVKICSLLPNRAQMKRE